MSNVELDNIISEGKVSPSVAMVVFAVELKSQGEKLDEMKQTITNDNKRYVTRDDHQGLEKRVGRIENGLLAFLGFVLITFVGALITLLINQGGS